MNIITYIYEKTRPYHFNIIVSILVIIFSIVAYYAYNKYFASKQNMKPFNNVANAPEDGEHKFAQIYFFYADWCPYCQKAKPEWNKFSTLVNKTIINGYLVECIGVDCTGDNGDIETNKHIDQTPHDTAELISKYNINSYPTIKLVKDDETIDFDAKITESSLHKFVNSVL
jgi:thiol-disulfide isomerase/thioredoxin